MVTNIFTQPPTMKQIPAALNVHITFQYYWIQEVHVVNPSKLKNINIILLTKKVSKICNLY